MTVGCHGTHQFLCANGHQCIPRPYICDGDGDCGDNSDEVNCISAGHVYMD